MLTRRGVVKGMAAAGLGGTAALAGFAAQPQPFATGPVKVITPFPAGSGPDAAMRVLAEYLGRKWGQPVVVDNRPGGNGFIAMAAFKSAPPNQPTLLMADSNHTTTHPNTFSRLPYDVEKDLRPIGMILRTPFFVAVAANSPYRSLEELVLDAKARPGAVTYGSWFIGSPGHIGALQLQVQRGIGMLHVPFKDFGQLYSGVATREVDWALGSAASAGSLVKAGKLRFLALAAPTRDPLYPDVPATSEMPTLRDFKVSAWAGLFAPHGAAQALVDRIGADVGEVLEAPEVVDRYKTFGYEAPRLSPAAFAQLIKLETDIWGKVIRAANLKLD